MTLPDESVLALSDTSKAFTLDADTRKPTAVQAYWDEAHSPLDSQAMTLDRNNSVWVADARVPAIRNYKFDWATEQVVVGETLPVPAALRVAPAGRTPSDGSFTGLTISKNGLTVYASNSAALAGDADGLVRIQTWNRPNVADQTHFRLGRQFTYQTDPALKVTDIQATPDGRILVLERGHTAQAGDTVRLYVFDPTQAESVSGNDTITAGKASDLVAEKTLLADLGSCPTLGATSETPQANPLLGNIDGLTVVSTQGDRRLKLLLVSNDDGRQEETTRLYDVDVTLPAEDS